MFNLIVETQNGERLDFSQVRDKYDILSVDGLTSPDTNINTSSLYYTDGCLVNSMRAEKRNIVITLNIKPPIELNRLELYRFFACKAKITLYWTNDSRDVYIKGIVEKFEANLFDKVQQPQISIICPQPYFISTTEDVIGFTDSESLFEFPFSISWPPGKAISEGKGRISQLVDVGEATTGIIIKISAVGGAVTNPTVMNRTTGDTFTINYTMSANQQIVVNSNVGEKSIYLYTGSSKKNFLSKRKYGTQWITCVPGYNDFYYTADSGSDYMQVEFIMAKKYQGV